MIADDYDRSDTTRILSHDRLVSPIAHPIPDLLGLTSRPHNKMGSVRIIILFDENV